MEPRCFGFYKDSAESCHNCKFEKDLIKHMRKIHGLSPLKMRKYTEEEKSEFVQRCIKVLGDIEGEHNGS